MSHNANDAAIIAGRRFTKYWAFQSWRNIITPRMLNGMDKPTMPNNAMHITW